MTFEERELMVRMIRELNDQVRVLIKMESETRKELKELKQQISQRAIEREEQEEWTTAFISSSSDPFIYHNPLIMTPASIAALDENDQAVMTTEKQRPIRTALIVDDDPFFQKLMAQHLSNLNISANSVASGREALEVLQTRQFDLILMDLCMPGMDGISTTREIRRNGSHPRTPIVTVTSAREGEERCRTAGMDAFLPKPISLEQLSQALDDLSLFNNEQSANTEIGRTTNNQNHANSMKKESVCYLVTENGLLTTQK